ncbi:MAG: hypothetical protein QXP16_04880, partial [Candidatus Bathyarchaeia archaeon]
ISITLAVIIILGAVIYQFFWQASESHVKFTLKAAIIDQLSEDANFRNQTFIDKISEILRNCSFSVTYYNYTETNVAFFKGLAKANYGIIILRLHSALREGGLAVDFFTSERYDPKKHTQEQKEGLLVNGTIIYSGKQFFAFTPRFVEKLDGTFPKSIIIAMGCQTLNKTAGQPMAKAFCNKGASVYIGWTGWISVTHSDNEITKLITRLFYGDETIEKAVGEAKPDYSFGIPSYLDFYPDSSGNLKISDLINEVSSTKSALFEGFHAIEEELVKRLNSPATVIYNWLRRLSPVKFNILNFLISSASATFSKTSYIHFSKSPR